MHLLAKAYFCLTANSDLSRPVYLLIQPRTSLCQASEFSGFKTHYTQVSISYKLWLVFATYVILIGEHQQPAGHAAGLQYVEHGQTLRHWQSVIQFVVDDQLRGGPLVKVLRGIPLLVALPVLPEGASEVMQGEEELLGGPLVERRKDAVVAHQCLELPSELVSLDPV